MSASPLPFSSNISISSPPFSFSFKPYSSLLLPLQRVKLFRSTAEATLFFTAKGMAELVRDKESGVAAAGTTEGGKLDVEHSRTFLDACSEKVRSLFKA
ncbi:Alpha/beta-Hydrolases superfamily protein isoform 1 [Hibiscus syriacus]|uniref:Alpha/beta-Hydrolases superfamily protein isoform 1 n=1 Tax=Hibiscus syriacus TaxID=106335 RepID=A0A6A3A375_HIBSY|nr:Alpha/beta-Hydrolases superfamily protein isoform 1 [Hibiscus syriacus]